MAAMSPKLKPLLLPQLVDERIKRSVEDLPYVYNTTNSSSSDVTSPVSPTFSATRGHYRGSSSASSLDLAAFQFQETLPSPTQPLTQKSSIRQLPDVVEEPCDEREEGTFDFADEFGLYSCLCDMPCEHRSNSISTLPMAPEHEGDYSTRRSSEGSISNGPWYSKRQDGAESPFFGLTTRLGSGLTSIKPWKSSKNATPVFTRPTTPEASIEHIFSGSLSSQSYVVNQRLPDKFQDIPSLATSTMSCYDSVESVDCLCDMDCGEHMHNRAALQRERAKATTPLLPPLMMVALSKPPRESPLQSPTVASPSIATETHSSPMAINYSRPSLSTRPSLTSLKRVPTIAEMSLPRPSFLQEQDEWSDRLGHANFTITPQPYELENTEPETLKQYRADWEAARVNYTKHLVRTGENYGETSKTYAFTEAKWAEMERRWRSNYEKVAKQNLTGTSPRQRSISDLRSRSRVRGMRGRSGSASASIAGRPTDDEFFAEMQWRRLEDMTPSAIPWLRGSDGKFPERGDEDIVGPMYRAEAMVRSQSEEKHGSRFWKNLVEKVGLRR